MNPDELPTINELDDDDVVHDDTEEREATSSPWGTKTPWGTTNPGPPLKRRMMFRAMRMLFAPPEADAPRAPRRAHPDGRARLVRRCTRPGTRSTTSALWDPETGTLLTGDHVLPSITPHVSGVNMADSLKSYLATLDLVAQLDGVRLGLPAHGHPFPDVPGRVAAIKEHHEERMELLRQASLGSAPHRCNSSRARCSRSGTGA